MPLPPLTLFDEIRRIHGHYCPMSTLGGRLGFAAKARQTSDAPLRAAYFIATCAVDGIRTATGCELSDGALQVSDRGRHALWLTTADGRGVFAELRESTLSLAGGYRTLDLALERDRPTLAAAELAQRSAEKDAFLDQLLQQLRQLPDDELMRFDDCLPAALAAPQG